MRCCGPAMGSKVAFIGGGQMAEAMLKGFLTGGVVRAEHVGVFDPNPERRQVIGGYAGVRVFGAEKGEVRECVADKDVVVIAVKPQYVGSALESIRSCLREDALLVSIAAGTSLDTLAKLCPEAKKVIRVMPNTPCLVIAAASAFCVAPGVPREGTRAAQE